MRRVAALLAACLALAAGCGGEGSGGVADRVDVFGPYLDGEADAFVDSLRAFERANGVRVDYTGSVDFVDDLRRRVASGVDAPDIAIVPQPGFIEELIDGGALVELAPATVAAVTDSYDLEREDLVTDGGAYSVPYRASVKSLVWYRPALFAERGWTVPRTLDELTALVDRIDAAGDLAPWCFGIFAGTSTGWAATDWIEDLLLRRAGPRAYDEWVAGTRPFEDPAVRGAFEEMERLVLASGRSAGGTRTVLEVPVRDAGAPLVEDPPGCALYKQASFATAWFPDDVELGAGGDVDAFVLPGVEPGVPPPLVVGGDAAVQFARRDAVDRLMAYLATPAGARALASRGGFVSARAVGAGYYRGIDARLAGLLREGRVARFDGSDRMPLRIGSDLLWREMTAWIAGAEPLDDLVATMDAARGGS